MQTLVTGGAGFIGSHLVEHLLKDNHRVIVLDNFSMGRRENLTHIEKNSNLSNLKIIEVDITDFESIKPYFKNIDWVFHLAALGSIVESIKKPLKYYHSNVSTTVNVLEASRLAKVKRFIYAASSSCYGIPDTFPTPESADIRPQYPYALSKYLGELCTLHWGKVYKVPVVSLRQFKVYGPRSPISYSHGGIFGVFLSQKLAGKPFTVVGDGTQSRDFVYITDVVRAFIAAAQSNIINEVFNVGSGRTYSIEYLVRLLNGPAVYTPKRVSELRCTHADISKTKKMLGWEPEIPFEEGVRRLVANMECLEDYICSDT